MKRDFTSGKNTYTIYKQRKTRYTGLSTHRKRSTIVVISGGGDGGGVIILLDCFDFLYEHVLLLKNFF